MSTRYYYKNPKTLTTKVCIIYPSSSTLELWKVLTWLLNGIWPAPHKYYLLDLLFLLCRYSYECTMAVWLTSDFFGIISLLYVYFLKNEIKGKWEESRGDPSLLEMHSLSQSPLVLIFRLSSDESLLHVTKVILFFRRFMGCFICEEVKKKKDN